MLPFARPGSVVIIVHPYNFRVPDWKLMGYYAGLRVLELVTLNVSYSIGNEANPVWVKNGVTQNALTTPFKECTHILCRAAIRERDTFVPPSTFEMFLTRAIELLREPDNAPRLPCEKPEPWPVSLDRAWTHPYFQTYWGQYGFELNYEVCEPPEPNCICCKSEACLDASKRMKRPV